MGKIYKSDKRKLFDTQIGQRATVQRTLENGSHIREANEQLNKIGEALNPITSNKSLKYYGSFAGHIYYNETMKQIFVVSQVNTLKQCPESLAQAATKDTVGAVIEFFGRKRPKLRSGF